MSATRPPRRAAPGLDVDAVDAAGLFGLLSGVLATVLPYFLGLTFALSALLLALAMVRRAGQARAPGALAPAPLACAVVGWGVALAVPLGAWRGLLLATCSLPLWWRLRRAPAFGGG